MPYECKMCGTYHMPNQCPVTGPAPKEEEMEPKWEQHEYQPRHEGKTQAMSNAARIAERRAVARDAYMAALGGASHHIGEHEAAIVKTAVNIALETVRRWDAFMASVDAEGGE